MAASTLLLASPPHPWYFPIWSALHTFLLLFYSWVKWANPHVSSISGKIPFTLKLSCCFKWANPHAMGLTGKILWFMWANPHMMFKIMWANPHMVVKIMWANPHTVVKTMWANPHFTAKWANPHAFSITGKIPSSSLFYYRVKWANPHFMTKWANPHTSSFNLFNVEKGAQSLLHRLSINTCNGFFLC